MSAERLGKLLVFLVLAACTPVITPTNQTSNVTPELSQTAEFGDLITINYVLSLENGTVVDTNDEQLAQQNNLRNYIKGPYTFILGQSGKTPGFDEQIKGLALGSHGDFIIQPSEPEIIVPMNKTILRPRFVTVPLYQKFPKKAFENIFHKKPIIGDVVQNKTLQFKYQIINMSNTSVLAKMILRPGEQYVLQNTYWPSTVIKAAEEDAMFRFDPEDNMTIYTPLGPATISVGKSRIAITHQPKLGDIINKSIEISPGFSVPYEFEVIRVEDAGFVIKRIGILADKTLHLSVNLLNLTKDIKDVKDDKPKKFITPGQDTGN